ncbi:MAG: PorT family protein [Bacteroidales bacterium]|nr:PorT family protein [Bacteroidales bacterium]
MKLVKLFIVAAVLAVTAPAFAQDVNFGVLAGFNSSNASVKIAGNDVDDLKSKLGTNIGAFVDFNFSEKLALETGLQFEQKGHKYEEEIASGFGFSIKFTTKTIINYLTIPVNARLNLPLGEKNLYFLAGPTLGIAISGKEKLDGGDNDDDDDMEFDEEDDEDKLKFGNEDDCDYRRLNIGARFGVGFEFSNKLGIRCTYDLGLSNLVPKGDSDNSYKSKAFGIALTYKF